jgi:hypothetical protein
MKDVIELVVNQEGRDDTECVNVLTKFDYAKSSPSELGDFLTIIQTVSDSALL